MGHLLSKDTNQSGAKGWVAALWWSSGYAHLQVINVEKIYNFCQHIPSLLEEAESSFGETIVLHGSLWERSQWQTTQTGYKIYRRNWVQQNKWLTIAAVVSSAGTYNLGPTKQWELAGK